MQRKMFDNSDDYDFNPSGSSKLASLFDNPVVPDNLNSSLTYTAPKQPKTKKEVESNEPAKSKPQTSLLLAKVVSLWKLENKDYKTLGKHGLAIIGSSDLNIFEIIVYREKNNILLRKKISNSCSFYNQKDSYSSFYDNENQNWLVKFESISDQSKFCKEIQCYGANIINNMEETSQKKEKTSSVTNKENLLTKPDIAPKLLQSAEYDVEEVNSDSSGSQKRANILSRMAKMGQQILPNQILKNTSTDISDSELDDSKHDRKIPPRKFKRSIHTEKNIAHKEESAPQTYLENQMVPSQSNNCNYPPLFPPGMSPVLFNQPLAFDGYNNYIATQNSELKMNLAQISAKLDSALSGNNTYQDKFEDRALKSKIKALQLKSENLQAMVQRYEEKYNDLQTKYDELKKKNNPIEITENKIIIQNLQDNISKLKLDLKMVKEKNTDNEKLEQEIETYKSNIKEFENTIEIQKLKLKDYEEFYEENKDNKNLQSKIDNLNETVLTLELKLKDLETYFHKTEAEKQKRAEENNKIMNIFEDKIKEHMNNMYQSVLANFSEDSSYSMPEIKSVFVQNLKGTTFKIIEDFTNIYKNDSTAASNESQI
ncbi:hypothetical protein NQ314_012563 [Rhamnusium bicolor]|uniref:Uncharacterized protein n=1 Tax=Rhamnusium bicolor TaxID=1586634 RepID=A0AAV8XBS2_9CUCU|nr:hypothetical protein NQ314_012563 [Rhamnusium bicolor]